MVCVSRCDSHLCNNARRIGQNGLLRIMLLALVWEASGQFYYRGGPMFGFYSNQLGCLGSLVVSLIGTAILILAVRSCAG